MNVFRFAFIGAVVILLGGVTVPRAEVDASISVNFGELNDYGDWTWMPGHGTVWRPYADEGWRPFMYGHWLYTDDGWLWDADEPFGWIVFHYGNWTYDDELGWVWVPGYEWSPARVEWYVTDREVAWAPLLPPPLPGRPRVSVSVNHWMFSPLGVFSSVELHSHINVRARPSHRVNVTVSSAPPRFEVVRRMSVAPVVRVTPNRVRVNRPGHALVRVEVANQPERRVVVPVGPRYMRPVVRTEQRSSVTVTREEDSRAVIRPSEPSKRVTVTRDNVRTVVPGKSATVKSNSTAKVRVQSKRSDDEDEDDDNDDDGRARVKVRVND